MEKPAISAQPVSASESAATSGEGVGPIRSCVYDSVRDYFRRLDGAECCDLYELVLKEVEVPLLQVVMTECGGNQSKAARLLGINRGTLRKKLRYYGLDE